MRRLGSSATWSGPRTGGIRHSHSVYEAAAAGTIIVGPRRLCVVLYD